MGTPYLGGSKSLTHPGLLSPTLLHPESRLSAQGCPSRKPLALPDPVSSEADAGITVCSLTRLYGDMCMCVNICMCVQVCV